MDSRGGYHLPRNTFIRPVIIGRHCNIRSNTDKAGRYEEGRLAGKKGGCSFMVFIGSHSIVGYEKPNPPFHLEERELE